MKRVIGIGNALTDMLVNLESDSVLRKYLLEKGSMSLVDSKLQTEISKSVAGLPYSLSLGGSAGNTIRAMARLGCGTGFIGKVGPDTTGDFFEQALANLGVKPFIFRGSERSGKCVALISPDGERTMITHLGAALELTAADVRADIFEGFDCVYIEGYLVQNHELIEHTARTAKERGSQVAIDLASFNIVKENLDFLRALVEKYVDIVFANEDEAIAFTGENEPINALQAISQLCELAIVKIGITGRADQTGRARWCTWASWPPPGASTRRAQATSTPRGSSTACAPDSRFGSAAPSARSRRAKSSRWSARPSARRRGRTSSGS